MPGRIVTLCAAFVAVGFVEGCGRAALPTSPADVTQTRPPSGAPGSSGIVEVQGLQISRFAVSVIGPNYVPVLELRETTGLGSVVVTNISYLLNNGHTDRDCPGSDGEVNVVIKASASWSLSELGYCGPYPANNAYPAVPTAHDIRVDIMFTDRNGQRGRLYTTVEITR